MKPKIEKNMKAESGVPFTASSANNGCALVTGVRNLHKRDFVSAMIGDSLARGYNTVLTTH